MSGPTPFIPNNPSRIFTFSGSITSGGTPQLVVPGERQRSYFEFVNNSTITLYLEIGEPQVSANLTSNSIGTLTVMNVGFGYTYAPNVVFVGGGPAGNLPDSATNAVPWRFGAPTTLAQAHVTISSGSIATIIIDYAGAGYVTTPYIRLEADPRDPFGCARPTASTGIPILPGGSYTMSSGQNATGWVATGPVSVFGATTGSQFACKVA